MISHFCRVPKLPFRDSLSSKATRHCGRRAGFACITEIHNGMSVINGAPPVFLGLSANACHNDVGPASTNDSRSPRELS